MRYVLGHISKKWGPGTQPQPCACGCGELTTVYRGQARRFVHGHNCEAREITEADYSVEDRGYETPCWIWRGAGDPENGRARVTIKKRKRLAYRVIYEQLIGPIPPGRVLDHLCEIPACVRPDHLQAITQSEHIVRHGIAGWNRTQVPTRLA